MQEPWIVVIGASAGGVEALIRIASRLNPEINAAICIVMHVPAEPTSLLPSLITSNSEFEATHAKDHQEIERSRIYVAPPDFHMRFVDGRIVLDRGPRVNRHRPAIDVTFQSAAEQFGERTVGVILTGSLNDGAAGLGAVQHAGGITIVQDPVEALYPSMPQSALRMTKVQYILTLNEIAETIGALTSEEAHWKLGRDTTEGQSMAMNEKIALDLREEETNEKHEEKSVLTCPDCGGALWEKSDNGETYFACHQGHRLTADSVMEGQSEKLEEALWIAARLMKEKAVLCRKLATTMMERGNSASAKHFQQRADEMEGHLATFKNVLVNDKSLASDL